jgi:hypothetical protein
MKSFKDQKKYSLTLSHQVYHFFEIFIIVNRRASDVDFFEEEARKGDGDLHVGGPIRLVLTPLESQTYRLAP